MDFDIRTGSGTRAFGYQGQVYRLWKGSKNSQHNNIIRAAKILFFFCKRSGGKEKKQTGKLTYFSVYRILLGKE